MCVQKCVMYVCTFMCMYMCMSVYVCVCVNAGMDMCLCCVFLSVWICDEICCLSTCLNAVNSSRMRTTLARNGGQFETMVSLGQAVKSCTTCRHSQAVSICVFLDHRLPVHRQSVMIIFGHNFRRTPQDSDSHSVNQPTSVETEEHIPDISQLLDQIQSEIHAMWNGSEGNVSATSYRYGILYVYVYIFMHACVCYTYMYRVPLNIRLHAH